MESNSRIKQTFILQTLENILKNDEMKKFAHFQLKRACEIAINEMQKGKNLPFTRYIPPLLLACQTSSAPIIKTALHSIQKLIEDGLIADLTTSGKLITDKIVEVTCACFTGPQTDQGVQLQVIKTLMAVIISRNLEVNADALLLAVRTCYNIFLASKNLINQTTAIAITEILKVLLTQVENWQKSQVGFPAKNLPQLVAKL